MITLKRVGDIHSAICLKWKLWEAIAQGPHVPGWMWKIWKWVMNDLQTADGQGCNVVSISFLVNLYSSILCFMGPGRSHRWCHLLPAVPKLQTLHLSSADIMQLGNFEVNTVSLSIMILAVQCEQR